ncbi:MAG: isochorismatase family protein [Gammaproteobacteria bacterium]|nr:isochorismatase family protein [Gammaproteobacteria bacterium]
MSDWRPQTLRSYQSKGFAERSGFGTRPALLIVDFINGFTDPASPLGGDFSAELAQTQRLLDAFRASHLPVAYTTTAYSAELLDGGHFVRKIPSLALLQEGSPPTYIDERIKQRPGEHVVVKKYASAFFGTDLYRLLQRDGVDTVVLAGCTTSGCVRASAVDSLQYGFRTVVVADAVGDRAREPHEASLFDIDAKYGDVISTADVLSQLARLACHNVD